MNPISGGGRASEHLVSYRRLCVGRTFREQFLNAVEQQVAEDGVALAEVLARHSVEVAAAEALELLAAEVVHGVGTERRPAGHVEDHVEHVAVAPVARVKSLPLLVQLILYNDNNDNNYYSQLSRLLAAATSDACFSLFSFRIARTSLSRYSFFCTVSSKSLTLRHLNLFV